MRSQCPVHRRATQGEHRCCFHSRHDQDTHITNQDIFTVIITSILPALADPANAYNAQHVYILQSLAESQSILLVTDIPNHENLIVSLFTTAFDIVSGSGSNPTGVEVSKSVEYHLKNLLASVVDEVNLPQDVTDIIISQFMRIDPRPVAKASTKSKGGKPKTPSKQLYFSKTTLQLTTWPSHCAQHVQIR